MNRILRSFVITALLASNLLAAGCAVQTDTDQTDADTEHLGSSQQSLDPLGAPIAETDHGVGSALTPPAGSGPGVSHDGEVPSASGCELVPCKEMKTQLTVTNASAFSFGVSACAYFDRMDELPSCWGKVLVSGQSSSSTGEHWYKATKRADVWGVYKVGKYEIPFKAWNPSVGQPVIQIQGATADDGYRLAENETVYFKHAIAPRTADDFKTGTYVEYMVRVSRGVDVGAKQLNITVLTEGTRKCAPFSGCTMP